MFLDSQYKKKCATTLITFHYMAHFYWGFNACAIVDTVFSMKTCITILCENLLRSSSILCTTEFTTTLLSSDSSNRSTSMARTWCRSAFRQTRSLTTRWKKELSQDGDRSGTRTARRTERVRISFTGADFRSNTNPMNQERRHNTIPALLHHPQDTRKPIL